MAKVSVEVAPIISRETSVKQGIKGSSVPVLRGLANLDPAQREAIQTKAREARAARHRARQESPLRRDFADAAVWERLARAAGIRLAPWGEQPAPGKMGAFLRRLGVTVAAYLEWAGERDLKQFAARNPAWPLRAWQGLVLERFGPAADQASDQVRRRATAA